MFRRSGVTLVEVLVAIFVMGIGLIALLTLFPIGILRMGLALHQQRGADSARNADAVAIFQNIRNDPYVLTSGGANDAYNNGKPIYDMFANPGASTALGASLLPSADPYGESYPILVDPIGYYSVPNGNAAQDWVGGSVGILRRRPVSFALNPNGNAAAQANLYRNFTLWDDMVYNNVNDTINGFYPGAPQKDAAGTYVLRDARFSWAYTMRRPTTSDRSVVDCSIVVFDTRSLSTSGTGSLAETVYFNQAYFNPNNSTITVDYSPGTSNPVPPPVRAGDWIMDTSFAGYSVSGVNYGSAHAYWYRVVAAEDLVINGKNLTRFEVQQPVRGFVARPGSAPANPLPNTLAYKASDVDPTDATGATPAYQGTIVILDGVAAVYEKGPARLP